MKLLGSACGWMVVAWVGAWGCAAGNSDEIATGKAGGGGADAGSQDANLTGGSSGASHQGGSSTGGGGAGGTAGASDAGSGGSGTGGSNGGAAGSSGVGGSNAGGSSNGGSGGSVAGSGGAATGGSGTGGSCVDECTIDARECLGAASCRGGGNFDADDCTEWTPQTACAGGASCQDGKCGGCTDSCSHQGHDCESTSEETVCGDSNGDGCFERTTHDCAPPEGRCWSGVGCSCDDECHTTGSGRYCRGDDIYLCAYDTNSCLKGTLVDSCSGGQHCWQPSTGNAECE